MLIFTDIGFNKPNQMEDKKNIIISGINLFEGGPLSIIVDCLTFLNKSKYVEKYNFIALVHKRNLFNQVELKNIEFIEFPKSRKSYLYRLYYEYVYFKKIAQQRDAFFWLSLHDITPSLGRVNQAVYCHNPSPFNTINFKDIFIQPIQFFFRLFYKYLYKINIKKNKYVIVQQTWIKDRFKRMFNLKSQQILVAPPQIPKISPELLNKKVEVYKNKSHQKTFLFPTYPRPFKNIEIICEAAVLLAKQNLSNFKIIITIDGTENKYAQKIVKKYKHIKTIDFIGLVNREEVYRLYSITDCLIFPSKLETWGLPISEFKQFNKPIFVVNLPYATETLGLYPYACFFNPNDANKLSKLMISCIEDNLIFDKTKTASVDRLVVRSWGKLFESLLK